MRDYDLNCEICRFTAENGWNGLKKKAHCNECHSTWGGTRVIHCAQCHLTFGSPSALDLHQPRDGICIDPALAVTAAGDRIFGDPLMNVDGVLIWRAAGSDDWDLRVRA